MVFKPSGRRSPSSTALTSREPHLVENTPLFRQEGTGCEQQCRKWLCLKTDETTAPPARPPHPPRVQIKYLNRPLVVNEFLNCCLMLSDWRALIKVTDWHICGTSALRPRSIYTHETGLICKQWEGPAERTPDSLPQGFAQTERRIWLIFLEKFPAMQRLKIYTSAFIGSVTYIL